MEKWKSAWLFDGVILYDFSSMCQFIDIGNREYEKVVMDRLTNHNALITDSEKGRTSRMYVSRERINDCVIWWQFAQAGLTAADVTIMCGVAPYSTRVPWIHRRHPIARLHRKETSTASLAVGVSLPHPCNLQLRPFFGIGVDTRLERNGTHYLFLFGPTHQMEEWRCGATHRPGTLSNGLKLIQKARMHHYDVWQKEHCIVYY